MKAQLRLKDAQRTKFSGGHGGGKPAGERPG